MAVGISPLFTHRGEQGQQAQRRERHRKRDLAACWAFNLVPSKAEAFQQGCCCLFHTCSTSVKAKCETDSAAAAEIYGSSQRHGEGQPHCQHTWTHGQLQLLLIACPESLGPVPTLLVTGAVVHKPQARQEGFSSLAGQTLQGGPCCFPENRNKNQMHDAPVLMFRGKHCACKQNVITNTKMVT